LNVVRQNRPLGQRYVDLSIRCAHHAKGQKL
jgi:hypothetical protein